jgi:hypothetical protein
VKANRGRKTLQGTYKPINPSKYKGNASNIVYRSSWELKFMYDLDKNPNVLEWSSEEHPIPYRCPIKRKVRRYFVDFWMKWKDKNGIIREAFVEIKPFKETIQPVQGNRHKKTFQREVFTYANNKAKWDACKQYCQGKGIEFLLLTEHDLGIKTSKPKKENA